MKETKRPATISGAVADYHNGSHSIESKMFRADRIVSVRDCNDYAGYGVEIEMESAAIEDRDILGYCVMNIAAKYFNEGLWKMERDGSLGGESSLELISQVMTKGFIRKHYRDFEFMYDDVFPNLGVSCSDSGRCGMHISFSKSLLGKNWESSLRKFIAIIGLNFSFFEKYFHRNPDSDNSYYKDGITDRRTGVVLDVEDYKRTRLSNWDNHYAFINTNHIRDNRIELRIVGGCENYKQFVESFEMVFHLVKKCQEISWEDVENLSVVLDGCVRPVYQRACFISECSYWSYSLHKIVEEKMFDTNINVSNEKIYGMEG